MTADTEEGPNRWSQISNETPALPDLSEPMEVLANYLLEVGPFATGEGGLSKISWVEIKAWTAFSETVLGYWEALTIATASSAYAAAVTEYAAKSVDAPYARELTEEDRRIEEAVAGRRIEAQIDKAWIGPENDA